MCLLNTIDFCFIVIEYKLYRRVIAIYRTIYSTKFEGMDHQCRLDLSDLHVHVGPHCLPINLHLSILKLFAT